MRPTEMFLIVPLSRSDGDRLSSSNWRVTKSKTALAIQVVHYKGNTGGHWTAICTGGHKSQRVITAFMRAHLDDSVKGWFWHRRGAFVPLLSHCKLYIESLSFRCFANRALSNWLIKVNVIFLRSDGQSNYFTDGTLFLLSLSTKIKI